MRIEFGKYRGRPIGEVPEDYLEWLLTRNRQMCQVIEQELASRRAAAEAKLDWVQRIIASGYRELSKRHHPDHGGALPDMQALNAAVERLRRVHAF